MAKTVRTIKKGLEEPVSDCGKNLSKREKTELKRQGGADCLHAQKRKALWYDEIIVYDDFLK